MLRLWVGMGYAIGVLLARAMPNAFGMGGPIGGLTLLSAALILVRMDQYH